MSKWLFRSLANRALVAGALLVMGTLGGDSSGHVVGMHHLHPQVRPQRQRQEIAEQRTRNQCG